MIRDNRPPVFTKKGFEKRMFRRGNSRYTLYVKDGVVEATRIISKDVGIDVECWYRGNYRSSEEFGCPQRDECHRDGYLPASTVKYRDTLTLQWRKEDDFCCDGGLPNAMTFSERLATFYGIHTKNGEIHSEYDLPAIVIHFSYDSRWRLSWYTHGLIHRKRWPAIITYKYGVVTEEVWLKDDEKHNSKGPAERRFDDTGALENQTYWLHGKHVSEDEWRDKAKPKKIVAVIWRHLPYPIASAVVAFYCRG